METIYNIIANRLTEQVPEIAWIDLDNGQLEYAEYRAAIAFPAVLIDIAYVQCQDMGHSGEQLCDVRLQLRVVSQQYSDTHMAAPPEIRQQALQHFALLQQIQKALQWHAPHDSPLDAIARAASTREPRKDGLMVQQVVYTTRYYDTDNAVDPNTPFDGAGFDMQP